MRNCNNPDGQTLVERLYLSGLFNANTCRVGSSLGLRAFAIVATLMLLSSAQVSAQQLIGNPDFDVDLSHWILPVGSGSAFWSSDDSAGSVTSGSAIVITTAGQGTGDEIAQCFPVVAGTFLEAAADYRIPGGQSEPGSFGLVAQFFSSPGCPDDDFVSAIVGGSQPGVPTDEWLNLVVDGTAPASSVSVRVIFVSRKSGGAVAGQPFEVHVDATRLTLFPGLLFANGFETGSTEEWSSSTP